MVEVADESTAHGTVVAMTHAVVLQLCDETGSTVLPGILILKSKYSAEDRVTTGCFTLHCLLHTSTCKHRASTIKTECLLLHEYKSKELGYDIS